jgi:hypothetical protein
VVGVGLEGACAGTGLLTTVGVLNEACAAASGGLDLGLGGLSSLVFFGIQLKIWLGVSTGRCWEVGKQEA